MKSLPSLSNAALIIKNGNFDEFVAVHRKENKELVCLPGGKVDPGENILEAIVREVKEETGLTVNPIDCIPFFTNICPGDKKNYLVTVFLINLKENVALKSEEIVDPFWINKKDFFQRCKFKDFNEKTFSQLENLLINKT